MRVFFSSSFSVSFLFRFFSLSLFPRIDEPLRTVKLENIAGKQSGPPAGKQRNKLFPVDAKFVTVKISETNKQKGKVPQRRKRNEMRFPIQRIRKTEALEFGAANAGRRNEEISRAENERGRGGRGETNKS